MTIFIAFKKHGGDTRALATLRNSRENIIGKEEIIYIYKLRKNYNIISQYNSYYNRYIYSYYIININIVLILLYSSKAIQALFVK